jgi:hypothetical protein
MKIRVMTKRASHKRVDQLLLKAEHYEELFLNTLAEIEEVVPLQHPLRHEIAKLRRAHLCSPSQPFSGP